MLDPTRFAAPESPPFEAFRDWQDSSSATTVVPHDSAFAAEQEVNASAANDDEFAQGPNELRVQGYMLTWHGRWGSKKPEVAAIASQTQLSVDAVVTCI